MTQPNQENLLSRWSRRKQQTAVDTQKEDQFIELQQIELSNSETNKILELDLKEQEVVLTDEDMPALETLNQDSDFSGFMSSGVSDELRNLALRKLFQAPSFNLRDGLDEYDEDYTSFEKLGDLVTCDMKHQIEMEAKKKLEEETSKLSENDSVATSDLTPVEQSTPDQSEEINLQSNEQFDSETIEQLHNDTPEKHSMSTAKNNE
jgi:hypothetical protein